MERNKNVITTGAIRRALAETLMRSINGEVSASDGAIIIGTANQLTHNMSVEIKNQSLQQRLGQEVTVLGMLNVAD